MARKLAHEEQRANEQAPMDENESPEQKASLNRRSYMKLGVGGLTVGITGVGAIVTNAVRGGEETETFTTDFSEYQQ